MQRPDPSRPLRIGTRGSPLALAQAHETRERLTAAWSLAPGACEIVVIQTTGDRVQDRPLSALGGKGLFTREIEAALIDGGIDLAVHSTKDMPTLQPEGLALDCFLPREDVRDAFIAEGLSSIADLPEGATVGTSSLRRRAQLLRRRPDLRVVEFRGNVQTRLRKLSEGVASATFLAMAGIRRLGISVPATPIPPDDLLPAVAQGAIGIERRADDDRVAELLMPLHHAETAARLAAERAFLAALDGSCQTPIAGLAEIAGDRMRFRGEILLPDGSAAHADDHSCAIADGPETARTMAAALLAQAGPAFRAAFG